ncbi:unnamed protein product [Brassica oleracea]
MVVGEQRKKIIIDTDLGIDDAMAIFVALKSPEVDVIGLTTIYGNVYTTLATRNALHLASFILYTFGSYNEKLEVAGRTDIPVAEGTHKTIMVPLYFYVLYMLDDTIFDHFLILSATLMQAVQLDPEFSKNVGQIVLLGGAFAVNGNIFGAREAADIVFTCVADVIAVGINVTHQLMTGTKWPLPTGNELNTYVRSLVCTILIILTLMRSKVFIFMTLQRYLRLFFLLYSLILKELLECKQTASLEDLLYCTQSKENTLDGIRDDVCRPISVHIRHNRVMINVFHFPSLQLLV